MSFDTLPDKLPVPHDDGAADHLTGSQLPDLTLPSTSGDAINLSKLAGTLVLYTYPMTGRPGVLLPDGWDGIPGARGCTPQSCSFRDHLSDLQIAGVSHVFGLSTQTTQYQSEAAIRLHLPFSLLSDAELKLQQAMNLPVMQIMITGQHSVLVKRLALVARNGRIEKVFYPVFPPDRNAADVLAWLQNNPA